MKKFFLFAMLLMATAAMNAATTPKAMLDGDSTFYIEIAPRIPHGVVLTEPTEFAMAGERVSILVDPENGYQLLWVSVTKQGDQSQTVPVNNMAFTMPQFNVYVDAAFGVIGNGPVINGQIAAPAAICAGSALVLTPPEVTGATQTQWQISSDKNFTSYEVYTNQPLGRSYNGWKLRFMASNSAGTVYSNTVTITVNNLGDLSLTGDLSACTRQESNYAVAGASNVTYSWEVTDENATIEGTGKSVKILWGTAGRQVVTVTVEDTKIGCSETLEMQVAVQSFIKDTDLNNIVAKKHEGKDYILIYPNPKDSHYRYQWFKDGEPIQGATGQYYYPERGLEAGAYQVYISFNTDDNGNLICGAFTPVFNLTPERSAFQIQPNPSETGQELILEADIEGEALFTVFTLDGRMVFQQAVSGQQPTVQLNLAKGLYIGRLSQGDASEQVAKIVIR